MEFVKADQTVPLCNASGQGVERIGNALKRLQLPVRLAHKGMEMHARFGLDWNAGIETVHQKTFAASNAAPQIHAFRSVAIHPRSAANDSTPLFAPDLVNNRADSMRGRNNQQRSIRKMS